MMALWIILAILALLCIIFSCSLTLYVTLKDEARVSIGICGFRYRIYPSKLKTKKKAKKPQKAASNQPAKKKAAKSSPSPWHETADAAWTAIKASLKPGRYLFRHLRIIICKADFVMATGDAAETAAQYGNMCAIVYSLVGLLKSWMHCKVKHLHVGFDFEAQEMSIDFIGKVKIRGWVLLVAGIRMLGRIFVHTLQKGRDRADSEPPKSTANRPSAGQGPSMKEPQPQMA